MKIILTTTANQQLPIISPAHLNIWLNVISERAFINWLKLIVLAFERNKYVNIGALASSLGVKTVEFEKEIFEVLYVVGLIEVEYPVIDSQQYQHIIVHPFPYNNIEKNQSLKKSRQYRKQLFTQPKQVLKLQDVLVKHHNKLWADKIDKAIIVDIFKADLNTPTPIHEHEYAALIDQTLEKSSKPILNPTNYFKAVLRNYKEQKLKGMR